MKQQEDLEMKVPEREPAREPLRDLAGDDIGDKADQEGGDEHEAAGGLAEELKSSIGVMVDRILEQDAEITLILKRIDKLKRSQALREPLPSWPIEAAWNAGGSGGEDATSIFPEEVWLMILEKVPAPKDLWNCSNTCALFQKLLHDWKKPTWLFMQAFPYLFQYLPQNKILKCRLVSKGWNMVVDKYLESHPALRPHDKDLDAYNYRKLPLATPMQEKKFFLLNKFDFRLKQFHSDRPGFPYLPGRNPFIGRAVTLIIGLTGRFYEREYPSKLVERLNKAFWNSLYSFLKAFGEHIWYLTLDSCQGKLGESDDVDHDYQDKMFELITVDLFQLAPNLKRLTFFPSAMERYVHLSGKMKAGTIALAPKLEAIDAGDMDFHVENNSLVLELIKRNHSTLRVIHVNDVLWWNIWQMKLELPSLTELHLDRPKNGIDFGMLYESGDKCGVGLPNLRKLGVNLRGLKGSFDWLLDALHRFLGSAPLTTLRLSRGGNGGILSKMFLNTRWPICVLPTLKTLEVEHDDRDGFYNFLVLLPLVETVHVILKRHAYIVDEDSLRDHGSGGEPVGVDVDVDVNKFIRQGRMYHSNIWEQMTRLKLFTFRYDVYTRSG